MQLTVKSGKRLVRLDKRERKILAEAASLLVELEDFCGASDLYEAVALIDEDGVIDGDRCN
jgi:hypothetical protein